MHSCATTEEGKAEFKAKFDYWVNRRFAWRRNKKLWEYENIGWQHEDGAKLRAEIAELNSRIHRAKQIWKDYAYWD